MFRLCVGQDVIGDYDEFETMMNEFEETVKNIIGDKFDFIYTEYVNGQQVMSFEKEIVKNTYNNVDSIVKLGFYNSCEMIYILVFPTVLFLPATD